MEEIASPAPAKPRTQKPPSKRRWLRRVALVLGILSAAGAILGASSWQRIEREALALATTGQEAIKTLSAQAKAVAEADLAGLSKHYLEGYEGAVLGDWAEAPGVTRDGIEVRRWRAADASVVGTPEERLSRFLSSLASVDHSKLKLDLVEEIHGDGGATVRSILWFRGRWPDGRRYEMQGLIRLNLAAGEGGWKIAGQELISGETVTGPATAFREAALDSGLDFVARQNPAFSTPEFEPKKFGIVKYASAGVSAADYDGDGWDDLFFADGAASRLFHNEGDGSFRETTEEAGLPTPLSAVSVAIFADFDNDGDQDLFLGRSTAANQMYENDGNGRFRDVTETANVGDLWVTVASAADYDQDGLLDLYVGRYLDPRTELPDTMFYTRNGEGNSLLRNLGGLRFEDVTEVTGVREGGLTLGVAWADYDDDGDDDLYVANDFGRNALLRNEGDGTFSDPSLEAGALDFGFGMSSSWGDVDNDGDFDIYVAGIHSGQRWYGQATTLYQYLLTSMRQGTIRKDYPLYREIFGHAGSAWQNIGAQMVKGNSLLINDRGEGFSDIAEVARANPLGWYWGSSFLDYDYDGRLDIYAANGWISGRTHDDL